MSLLLAALLGAQALAVPFVPQQKDSCGAAALAMVLRFWQQPASQEEIAAALVEPELKGILGSRLAAFARGRGMTAIAYKGDMAQLSDFVGKGRPLIVAWRLGRDRYHDVVVVGIDERRVIVNDPAEGAARSVDAGAFEKRWEGAGYWTLLVLPAAESSPAP